MGGNVFDIPVPSETKHNDNYPDTFFRALKNCAVVKFNDDFYLKPAGFVHYAMTDTFLLRIADRQG